MLPLPSSHVRWSDRRLFGAWAAIALALVIALAFLPATMINADEVHYAGQARALLHGRLVPADGDAFPTPLVDAAQHVRYPLGWPLLLAPAAAIGFRWMYLLPLAAHLFGGALVGRLLTRRGISSWLAAAYLFHPLFWSFSRTLMSDLPAAVLLLAAMDAWEEGRPGRNALAIAYSCFIRIGAIISAVGFGLSILPDAWRRRRDVVLIGAASAVAIAVGWWITRLTHVDTAHYGYAQSSSSLLNGKTFFENLVLYGAGLLLIPPFPLLCIVLAFRRCERWILTAIPILVFFLLYSYHDQSARWLETLLGGQRLVLTAHVVLFVATAGVWSRLPLLNRPAWVLAGAALVGIAACLAVRRLERRYAGAVQAIAACEPARLGFNSNASRAALSIDAKEYHMVDDRDPVGLGDVVLIAPQYTSNRPNVELLPYTIPSSLRDGARSCRRVGEYYLFDMAGRCPAALEDTGCDPHPSHASH
ncbi:hypothetical protein [Pendulispora albinea]|uniref:Mannosyltransferase n=1 Tax=Pendulispora albinea TaxID=2741071 RepID=A0ABZ2LLV0_9BACT